MRGCVQLQMQRSGRVEISQERLNADYMGDVRGMS